MRVKGQPGTIIHRQNRKAVRGKKGMRLGGNHAGLLELAGVKAGRQRGKYLVLDLEPDTPAEYAISQECAEDACWESGWNRKRKSGGTTRSESGIARGWKPANREKKKGRKVRNPEAEE